LNLTRKFDEKEIIKLYFLILVLHAERTFVYILEYALREYIIQEHPEWFPVLRVPDYILTEGAIKLAEALKSNTSLTVLDINCNRLVVSFDSHSIQVIVLVMQEQSNYMK
jgi:hypothetical protein